MIARAPGHLGATLTTLENPSLSHHKPWKPYNSDLGYIITSWFKRFMIARQNNFK
jgi:hypothetical protein